jgi:hypothetical protein
MCKSNTAVLCKSIGKGTNYTLIVTAWQGKGMVAAWERHGMCELTLSYPCPINTPSYFAQHQQAWKVAICSAVHTFCALLHLSILNSHSDIRKFHEVVSIVTVCLVTISTNMHMLPTATKTTEFNRTLVWIPPQNSVPLPHCNYKS